MKIAKEDYKFAPINPDADFDPEHNQRVIDESIKATEALHRLKQRTFNEGLKERAWSIGHYVDSLKMGGQDSNLTGFFGDKELTRLKGEEIIKKIKKEAISPNGKAAKIIKEFYAKTSRQSPA